MTCRDRRVRGFRALTAAVVLVLLSGCGGNGATPRSPSPQNVVAGENCVVGKETLCIELGGVTTYVPSGHLDLAEPVVILDNGGPGVDPLAAATAQPPTSMANTLVVLEPWVQAPAPPRCAAALDQYVTSVRERGDRELHRSAAAFASVCASPLEAERRFATDAVGTLIKELRSRGVPRVVVLAVSFGAARVAGAAALADAVVLVAPYVGGRPLHAELARRTTAAEEALHFGATESALVERVRQQLPVRIPRRSVPFTAVDLDAAIVASAYDPARAGTLLRADLTKLARALDRRRPLPALAWITTAADHVEGRYGRQRYFRGLVGYFGGFCSVQADRRLAGRGAASFLDRFHQVCAVIEPPGHPAAPVLVRGCSIDSQHDPVASSTASVQKQYPRVGHVVVPGRGHASGADLSRGASMAAAFAAGEEVPC